MKKAFLLLILVMFVLFTNAQKKFELKGVNKAIICYKDTMRVFISESGMDGENPNLRILIDKGTGLLPNYNIGVIEKSYYVKRDSGNYSMLIKENGVAKFKLSKNEVGNPEEYLHAWPSKDPIAKEKYKEGLDLVKRIVESAYKLAKIELKMSAQKNLDEFKLALENKKVQKSFVNNCRKGIMVMSKTKNRNLTAMFILNSDNELLLKFIGPKNVTLVEYSKNSYEIKQIFKDVSIVCSIANADFGKLGKKPKQNFLQRASFWKSRIKSSILNLELGKQRKILNQ